MIRREQIEKLYALLERLVPRKRATLVMHYGLTGDQPMTYAEISDLFRVSDCRVGQLERSAIKMLRWWWNKRYLASSS
jgi:DNA-directed RNA polymerase sigma subunit (sigma70/sigma32)